MHSLIFFMFFLTSANTVSFNAEMAKEVLHPL